MVGLVEDVIGVGREESIDGLLILWERKSRVNKVSDEFQEDLAIPLDEA